MDDENACQAVQELFERYADGIYEYACYALGNRSDAKDAVQETFVRVVRAWSGFRGDAKAKTWLWRIANNCIIDITRKRKRRWMRETARAELEDLHDDSLGTPGQRVELLDLLRELTPPQRQVVTLRYLDDFSIRETARILGWNESKVRNTLHAAIVKLRTAMKETSTTPGEVHGREARPHA